VERSSVQFSRLGRHDDDESAAICTRDRERQHIPVLDLPLQRSRLRRTKWIEVLLGRSEVDEGRYETLTPEYREDVVPSDRPADQQTVAELRSFQYLRRNSFRNCREFAVRKAFIAVVALGIAERNSAAIPSRAVPRSPLSTWQGCRPLRSNDAQPACLRGDGQCHVVSRHRQISSRLLLPQQRRSKMNRVQRSKCRRKRLGSA
jgi:hypothetical protein